MLFRFLHTRGGGCSRARGKDQASAPAHGAYARGPTLDEAKARDESGDFGLPIPLPGEDAGGRAATPPLLPRPLRSRRRRTPLLTLAKTSKGCCRVDAQIETLRSYCIARLLVGGFQESAHARALCVHVYCPCRGHQMQHRKPRVYYIRGTLRKHHALRPRASASMRCLADQDRLHTDRCKSMRSNQLTCTAPCSCLAIFCPSLGPALIQPINRLDTEAEKKRA
jgi:hypothetical protein